MIFGKTKLHRLPKFPQTVADDFKSLCEVLSADALSELRHALEDYMLALKERAVEQRNVDLASAEDLADRCRLLLDKYPELTHSKQKLVVGAVRYFAVAEDSLSDEIFASGLDDDKMVMNFVLEELEIEDRYLSIG